MATIDILLATYNGGMFLPEQLESLAAQTHKDFQLIVRDDGSSDNTVAVVGEWASRTSHPVRILDDGRKGLGASANFGALLEQSTAPYFAFCDQDDVWLPNKLELMLKRARAAEERSGSHTPVLAYSDLRVVDVDLNEIHPSYRAYASLVAPRPGRLAVDLMTHNVVAGCASLGNAALRSAALPISANAMMHDWWLALTAALTGQLVDVPEATILYRQHGKNTVGATQWNLATLLGREVADFGHAIRSVKAFIADTQRQARAIEARFGADCAASDCAVVGEYGNLATRSLLARKKFALDHATKPRRTLRNAAFIAFT